MLIDIARLAERFNMRSQTQEAQRDEDLVAKRDFTSPFLLNVPSDVIFTNVLKTNKQTEKQQK